MLLGQTGSPRGICTMNLSSYVEHSIALYLYGVELDPEVVNESVGISCDHSFKKGSSYARGGKCHDRGMWRFTVTGNGKSLSEQFDVIYQLIPKYLRPISNIDGVESGRISLKLDESISIDPFEIVLDLEDIRKLNEIGVQFYLTYFKKDD